MELPFRRKKPRRIFVNSISDLFLVGVPDEFVKRVFATMASTDWHTYQVLTKCSKRLARLAPYLKRSPNLPVGTSVETNEYA